MKSWFLCRKLSHPPLLYRWEGQDELVQSQAVLTSAALITQTTNCDSASSGERNIHAVHAKSALLASKP